MGLKHLAQLQGRLDQALLPPLPTTLPFQGPTGLEQAPPEEQEYEPDEIEEWAGLDH